MGTVQNGSSRPVVGIMTGGLHTDYASLVVDSVCDALKDRDVDICLFQGLDASRFLNVDNYVDTGFDDHYYTPFEYGNFVRPDLLVVSYGTITGVANPLPMEEFLSRLPKVPIFMLEVEVDLPNVMCITVDNYNGMKECVDHLLEAHGCRSVLFLAGPAGVPDSELRLQAWRDAMTEHGLPVSDDMIAYGDFTDRVEGAVEQLLKAHPHPDAIVCANDDMAECTYRVLRRYGLEPGRDVAVTGFDNTASRLLPTLTSVTQNLHEIAGILAESIPAALAGELPKSVRLKSRVFYRQSCGCSETARSKPEYVPLSMPAYKRDARLKRLRRDSMLTPLMLRSLLGEHVDGQSFFHKLGELLWNLKTPYSSLALMPSPVATDHQRRKIVPSTLRLLMEQEGSQINAYAPNEAPLVNQLRPYAPNPGEKQIVNAFFPLFFGSTHYGVFMVGLDREQTLFYYTLSLEIGTAIRYLALSLAQQEDRAALEERNQILRFSASHDNLTGLYNRAGLMNLFFDLLRTNAPGTKCVLLMADLDHLKQINDTFGHSAGDEAIRCAARCLARSLPPNSAIGRTGGDEFTALVVLKDGETAEQLIERIHETAEEYNRNSSASWYLGISVGISVFEYTQPAQITEHLELADHALYKAKAHRRDNVIRIRSAVPKN